MKIRIKETGEVLEDVKFIETTFNKITIKYLDDGVLRNYPIKNLSDIEEVKVYEEPKEYWYIDYDGGILLGEEDNSSAEKMMISMGNHFDSLEEAEKAVEKLKAIQRLKSYYIKFKLDFIKNKIDFTYRIDGTLHSSVDEERIIFEDLELLFGGEE